MMSTLSRVGDLIRLGAVSALLAAGCSGAIDARPPAPGTAPEPGTVGTPGPSPSPPVNPADVTNLAGPTALRRLSLFEYRNTVRDLLGVEAPPLRGGGFTVDTASPAGFVNGASITSSVDAKQFVDASDQLASAAVARLGQLLPQGCSPLPAGGSEDTCVRTFIEQFGLRAYRRPPTQAEATQLFDFYRTLRGPTVGDSFGDAIKDLIAATIQTPQFLYRWELGEAPIKDGPLFRLNGWEIASRLSYFLWASMPDATLFDAARSGQLQSPQRIAQEARRMLADPRAKDAIRDFHRQWMDVEGLPDLQKDPALSSYTPETALSMLDETGALAESVLWGRDATGKLADLFSSSRSFVDGRLAAVYGVPNVSGDGLRPVTLDPAQRAGLLTQGSFLASHADADVSHPVKRGVAVIRNVLCLDLPDPTGLEIPDLPAPVPGQTTRERYLAHEKGACAGCHQQIDAVGFAFESYDAIGAFRTTEQGKPVDSSGRVVLPSGQVIAFDKGIDFIKALAATPELRGCVSRQWLRYVLHRTETPEEAGTLKALSASLESSGSDLRELLVTLTTTRAFTHRKPGDGEGP
jgi:hypothetical protein